MLPSENMLKAWKSLPRWRKGLSLAFGLVFCAILAFYQIWEHKHRLVLSDGSVFTIHRVEVGKRLFYYHNPVRRTIALALSDEHWTSIATNFPSLVSCLGISDVHACTTGPYPSAVVFGQVSLAGLVPPSIEFRVRTPSTNHSPAMETPVLDVLRRDQKKGWDGVCILAMQYKVGDQDPVIVDIYERNPTNNRSTLLATFRAKRVE